MVRKYPISFTWAHSEIRNWIIKDASGSGSAIHVPILGFRTHSCEPVKICPNRGFDQKKSKSPKNPKNYFLLGQPHWKKMKMKMVTRFYEAGLAALAKYALAFVFTHAHTHKRKPYTLCPLWARVHFPPSWGTLLPKEHEMHGFQPPLNITDIPLLLKLHQSCDMLNWYLTMAR